MTMHCMIDVETLDTAPSAVVLSLGAVIFNLEDETEFTYYASVLIGEQLTKGRTKSESTLQWWAQQSDGARSNAFDIGSKVSVDEMLGGLTGLIASANVQHVWGNGANFDNVIVADLYRSFEREAPWKFWQDRCFRTVREILDPNKRAKPTFEGTAHHALHDALHQTKWLKAIARANPTVRL